MWTQRSQYTNEQIPVSDLKAISSKHTYRENNHQSSAISKWKSLKTQQQQALQIGNLVYLYCDRDKSKARSRYIITAIGGDWCYIKKFTGRQIRASSYKVKLTECYRVPCEIQDLKPYLSLPDDEDSEDLYSIPENPDNFN